MTMRGILLLFVTVCMVSRTPAEATQPYGFGVAEKPPRGWNSYDSFAWVISEEEFMQNADIVSQQLLKHGYEYVIVDYLWYRRLAKGASRDSYGYDVIDKWGRVMPDPGRWPSSRGGSGFKAIAQKVHNMGLKFGIHLMRGISVQAVNSNTPILDVSKGSTYDEAGQQWRARDIGLKERTCAWMKHGFMSVNTDLGAGRAFLRSLYTQYEEWGVDFVKLDCIFGGDLDEKEIVAVSELLQGLERHVILSLSPGNHVTPDMAKFARKHANMYRITADDWDTWPDIESHFNIARDVAASHLIGSKGSNGRSWPDLDMLPLGWLTNSYGNIGPYRKCNLTTNEQKTQMTLWSMVKSPLIFGGDLRNTDADTLDLITNPILLEINSFSSNNMEFRSFQSITLREEINVPLAKSYKNRIGFTSCSNPLAKSWKIQSSDEKPNKIHWGTTEDTDDIFFHVDKSTIMQLGEICKKEYQGKVHLMGMTNKDLCLDASATRRLTASESDVSFFSPCEWKSSQIWELNGDGSVRSNYSGLCLVMERERDGSDAGGVRSWIATGRTGEVYLSFFNLNDERATVTTTIWDVADALPGFLLSKNSCNCSELWSGRDFGIIDSSLSMQVPGHGCALFTLHCNFSIM